MRAKLKNVRTTLELDDDLWAAAKELAKEEGVTLGRLISDLTVPCFICRRSAGDGHRQIAMIDGRSYAAL